MKIEKNVVFALVVGLVVGLFVMPGRSNDWPMPGTKPDRPFLTFVARAAKLLLWVSLAAEKPPEETNEPDCVEHLVDAEGLPLVDHGRGW